MGGTTLAMMCCLLTFQVQGCQVSRLPGRHERIRYLDELLRNSNESVFLENTAKVKSDAERHIVRRPPLGGRLELACNIRNTMERFTDRINMSQYPIWSQNGLQLRLDADILTLMPKGFHSCRFSPDLFWSTPFSKAFNWTTGIHTLILENISQYHAGEYECSGHTVNGFVVIEKFIISPIVTAKQVFDPPMENVAATVGDTVQLRCFVKFDLFSGSFDERFIWRHEEFIMSAPGVSCFQSIVGATKGFGGNVQGKLNSTYGCHSLVTIRKVDERHAGLYQCWFKVDDNLGEWVVQSVHLTIVK